MDHFRKVAERLGQLPGDQLQADAPIALECANYLKLITNWVTTHNQLLETFESMEYFGFEFFERSNLYSNAFLNLLGLSLSPSADSLMSKTSLTKFDDQLNVIKTKVFEILTKILEHIFNNLTNEQKQNIPYIVKMSGLIPILVKTAYGFATSPDLQKQLLVESNQQFIIQLLEVLTILSGEQQYIDVFVANQTHIIVSVCLNLMQTTSQEASLIIQDPSEFVNLGLDCCDKQKSLTVKTQACKLLENMCDNVDSATTCVTTFACNALDLALKKASGVQAPTPMFS